MMLLYTLMMVQRKELSTPTTHSQSSR